MVEWRGFGGKRRKCAGVGGGRGRQVYGYKGRGRYGWWGLLTAGGVGVWVVGWDMCPSVWRKGCGYKWGMLAFSWRKCSGVGGGMGYHILAKRGVVYTADAADESVSGELVWRVVSDEILF